MKFYVIGITDHPKPFFPPEVMAIISNGKVFSGGKRHHEIVAPLLPEGAEWIDITVPLDAVFEEFIVHSAKSIVIFASGDPLFFGFANTIRRKFILIHLKHTAVCLSCGNNTVVFTASYSSACQYQQYFFHICSITFKKIRCCLLSLIR